MKLTEPLSQAQFNSFLTEVIFRGFKWDVQIGDHCSVSRRGIILCHQSAESIFTIAEALCGELRKIEEWISRHPQALSKLGLPCQLVRLLRQNQPQAPRMARFDFHLTQKGWKISEVNSDVPGGYIEATMFPLLWPDCPANCRLPGNPAEAYVNKLLTYIKRGTVGLLHAPWFSEDRQHMEFLHSILSKHNIDVAVVGPEQVIFKDSKVFAYGKELQALIRFFPCEWLIRMSNAAQWFSPLECTISNPLFSIVSQTKKLPLLWNELPFDVPMWKRLLPDTTAFSLRDYTHSDRVLKPCLGRVGENIYLPGVTTNTKRSQLLRQIMINRNSWISQKGLYQITQRCVIEQHAKEPIK